MVNGAYDSTVDSTPQSQIEESEIAALRSRRAAQVRPGLPRLRHGADDRHRDGRRRLPARRAPLGSVDRPHRSRQQARRPAVVGPHHPRRPPVDGQDGAGHQHRLQHRQVVPRRAAAGRHDEGGRRRHRRLLLARNVGRAAGDAYSFRAGRDRLGEDPPRHDQRGRVPQARRGQPRDEREPALHRPDRRHLHRPARRARAQAEAAEGPRRA